MKKEMKNKFKVFLMSFILISTILLLISTVSAVAIGLPYWEGNPFVISPGQTGTVNLTIQNMVGEEDITMKAEIIQENEIASLKKDEYFIPISRDAQVPIKITIPYNATLNTTHKVKVSFKTVTPSSEGGVTIGIGIVSTFDVLVKEGVKEQPKEKLETKTLIIISIIVLIIIIAIVLKKQKLKKIFK